MRKLLVFNFTTLNGYFEGPGGVLLFGRVTYEHMASYWPTPQAMDI